MMTASSRETGSRRNAKKRCTKKKDQNRVWKILDSPKRQNSDSVIAVAVAVADFLAILDQGIPTYILMSTSRSPSMDSTDGLNMKGRDADIITTSLTTNEVVQVLILTPGECSAD